MNLLEIVAGRPVLGVGPDGRPRSLLQWVRLAASVPVPQICRHVIPCWREALHGLLARFTPSAGAWRPGFVCGSYETCFPLEIRHVTCACRQLDKLFSKEFQRVVGRHASGNGGLRRHFQNQDQSIPLIPTLVGAARSMDSIWLPCIPGTRTSRRSTFWHLPCWC
jgi:hypothetical protein